ncbi:MAG: dTMP kinase [Enterococcus sp.]
MTGLFITIEGPDGAGKTSILKELFPLLQKVAKVEMIQTREPGGIPISEKIREIILDPANARMDDRTEALLYAASRRQHLIEKVFPALDEGKIVICDRFVDSSLAYQGAGRKIGMDEIKEINDFATQGLEPDFTLYLDVDSDTGLRRIMKHRTEQIDRLDSEGLEFHQRVRHGYLKLVDAYPERIHKINARKGFEEVLETSYHTIVNQFPQFFEN